MTSSNERLSASDHSPTILEPNRSWGSVFMRTFDSGLTYADVLTRSYGPAGTHWLWRAKTDRITEQSGDLVILLAGHEHLRATIPALSPCAENEPQPVYVD